MIVILGRIKGSLIVGNGIGFSLIRVFCLDEVCLLLILCFRKLSGGKWLGVEGKGSYRSR